MKKDKELSRHIMQYGDKKQESAKRYSEVEIQQIVNASNGSGVGIAVQLALETRIRRSELSALKWSQVDTTARTVVFQCGSIGVTTDRRMAISEQLAKLLDTYKIHNLDTEFVFSDMDVDRSLRALCRKAAVPFRGFHPLRHIIRKPKDLKE
jgi:integrase